MTQSGPVIAGIPPAVLITPASPEFGAVGDFVIQASLAGTGTWFAANKPLAALFTLSEAMTVFQLGWQNGAGTMTDSVDVGIYDTAWNRKVSTGGTARSGVSALQFVDVADTVLTPGRYWLAMVSNGVTVNNSFQWTISAALLGIDDSATSAYPLPDPLTNMAAGATTGMMPVMFAAMRALV